MEDIKQMQNDIAAMTKQTSLRQIALQSGVNYITLRNIRDGKSKRVTEAVKDRFDTFKKTFDPTRFVSGDGSVSAPAAAPAAASAAAPAPKKRGRKPGPRPGKKAPAAKATTMKSAAPAAAKTVSTGKKAAAKKPGRKKGASKKTASRQSPARQQVAAPSKLDFASPVLGQALDREIEIAEARLDYLKSLRDIENEFLRAVGRK